MFKTKEARLNFFYSIGAAVVILGAFFKMTHTTMGGLINPNVVLGAGLIMEVIVFVVYAFNPPVVEEKYAWENVYPELLDANAEAKPRQVAKVVETTGLEVSLSDKLDKMLADAKVDVSLFERLKSGMDKFSDSVEKMNQTTDVSAATVKYNDQLNLAASHLESMNALYALQLEHGKEQAEYSKKYVADLEASAKQSEKFNQELEGLTNNITNLNRVYGGMLNAMKS